MNNRTNYLLLLFSSLLFLRASSQHTIYYYDKKWERVTKEKRYAYYREIHENGDLYCIVDYYRKGSQEMTGCYKDQDCKIKQGLFTWFGPVGDTLQVKKYDNGALLFYIEFFKDKKYKKQTYINDSTFQISYYAARGAIEKKKELHIGEREYIYTKTDSFLNIKHVRYSFAEKWPYVNTIGIKHKILPWVLAEDIGMVYSLGIEYSFLNTHSLELTGNYFDHELDAEDTYGNPIPTTYVVKRSLQFSYRYYFKPWSKFNWNSSKFYISPFVKYGKVHEYYQPGALTSYTRNENWDYCAGLLAGFNFQLGDSKRYYFDVFFGPQYIKRYQEATRIDSLGSIDLYSWRNFVNTRVGFNFCYLLFFRG